MKHIQNHKMLGYKGAMENTKISTGWFTQEAELETSATGLEISLGHWTLTNSDSILTDWNSLPSDTMTNSMNCREQKVWDNFLVFKYLKNFIAKCFLWSHLMLKKGNFLYKIDFHKL